MDDHHQRQGGIESARLERRWLVKLNQAVFLGSVGVQQELGHGAMAVGLPRVVSWL